jgi:hypothetical protein
LLARCFAELFYDPEDGGDTFFRNVGNHSTHYTASYPRRRYSSDNALSVTSSQFIIGAVRQFTEA